MDFTTLATIAGTVIVVLAGVDTVLNVSEKLKSYFDWWIKRRPSLKNAEIAWEAD